MSFSEEELAILKFSKQRDFYFKERESKVEEGKVKNYMVLQCQGQDKRFELLEVIEFTSSRKRMSVLVRDSEEKVFLLTKGADDILKGLVSPQGLDQIKELEPSIKKHTNQGLRAMLLVGKEMREEWYGEYLLKKGNIKSGKEREKLKEFLEEAEKDLEVLGAVFLEDKLQDGVHETCSLILKNGIKIWMITGDKTETAISVAKNAGLIEPQFEIIELDESNLENFSAKPESAVICPGRIFRKIQKLSKTN